MSNWTIKEPTTLTFDTVRRLRIKTVSGTVHVVGTDAAPTLEVTDISGKDLDVTMDENGVLDIGYRDWPFRWPGPIGWITGRGMRTAADLSVAVPKDCEVAMDVVSVTTVVSGIEDRVRIKGVNGDLTLARLADVDAGTVSGSIEAERISESFAAKTISGDITAVDLSGRTASFETVSGTITLDVQAPIPTMQLTTVSGDATIRLPYKCDADVWLSTTSGQVASSFAEIRSSGRPGSRTAEGRLGAGGPRLRGHTVSGHVTVLRRDEEDGTGEYGTGEHGTEEDGDEASRGGTDGPPPDRSEAEHRPDDRSGDQERR